jgi:hypothetical protein
MAEVTGRMAGDAHGEFRGWRVHRIPRRVVGQRHRLVVHHLRELLAAVADIDAPHAGRPVDQPFAGAIRDVDAVALADQGARLVADRTGERPGLNEVALGQLDGIGIAKRSRFSRPHISCSRHRRLASDFIGQEAWRQRPEKLAFFASF